MTPARFHAYFSIHACLIPPHPPPPRGSYTYCALRHVGCIISKFASPLCGLSANRAGLIGDGCCGCGGRGGGGGGRQVDDRGRGLLPGLKETGGERGQVTVKEGALCEEWRGSSKSGGENFLGVVSSLCFVWLAYFSICACFRILCSALLDASKDTLTPPLHAGGEHQVAQEEGPAPRGASRSSSPLPP
jgi:hypothetical protein